jgi:hypothetical protein
MTTKNPVRIDRKALWHAWNGQITAIQGNAIMTVAENGRRDQIQTQEDMRHLINRVQRDAYGRDWSRRPQAERITAIGFREHHTTNAHWHLLVRAPGECRTALANAANIWREIQPGGAFHFETPRDLDAYALYMTKDFWDQATADHPFFYGSRPLR